MKIIVPWHGSSLSLNNFIDEYKNNGGEIEENNQEIIIKVKSDNENKYEMYKKLYISKSTKLPTKMEILDINENVTVYILYNEIKINKTSKEEILEK